MSNFQGRLSTDAQMEWLFFFSVHSLETHFLDWSKDILHQILRQRTLDVKKEIHLSIYNLGQLLVFLCALWLLSFFFFFCGYFLEMKK